MAELLFLKDYQSLGIMRSKRNIPTVVCPESLVESQGYDGRRICRAFKTVLELIRVTCNYGTEIEDKPRNICMSQRTVQYVKFNHYPHYSYLPPDTWWRNGVERDIITSHRRYYEVLTRPCAYWVEAYFSFVPTFDVHVCLWKRKFVLDVTIQRVLPITLLNLLHLKKLSFCYFNSILI